MNIRILSKKKILLFLLFSLISTAVYTLTTLPRCSVIINNSDKDVIKVEAEVADTPAARTMGLMYRKELPENNGMLFVFERDQKLTFWMKNVPIPLSIAYIDSEYIIRDILDMAPMDENRLYHSSVKVRYALEVNRGFFERHKIRKGDRIIIKDCQ